MPDVECNHANGEYDPAEIGCTCECEKCYRADYEGTEDNTCICEECDH